MKFKSMLLVGLVATASVAGASEGERLRKNESTSVEYNVFPQKGQRSCPIKVTAKRSWDGGLYWATVILSCKKRAWAYDVKGFCKCAAIFETNFNAIIHSYSYETGKSLEHARDALLRLNCTGIEIVDVHRGEMKPFEQAGFTVEPPLTKTNTATYKKSSDS